MIVKNEKRNYIKMKPNVSTSNLHGSRRNDDSRLEINKKGKAFIHMKAKKNTKNDLFVLESSDNKVVVKIDSDGEIFLKGAKLDENVFLCNEHVNKPLTQSNEINLGSWKIISDGDNLLIQKCIDGEWVTKQHFN